MADLDIAAKVLLQEVPATFARLVLGPVALHDVTLEPTELPASTLHMDRLIRYAVASEDDPSFLHVEVFASPASDSKRRIFLYWSRAHEQYERSLVICLKPGNRRGALAEYVVPPGDGGTLRFQFTVVRLWELEATDLARLGLLPFAPFARDASVPMVEQAMRTLGTVVLAEGRAEGVRRPTTLLRKRPRFCGSVRPRLCGSVRPTEASDRPHHTFLRKRSTALLRE